MRLLSTEFVRRSLEPRDVPAVLAIQQVSPEAAQWKAADYTHIDQNATMGCVLEDQKNPGPVIAFLVLRRVVDEVEILNLAVHPEHRRRGVGAHLIAATIDPRSEPGTRKVFLEVRESNVVAISFYKHFKFIEVGRRRGYYRAPEEDALILARNLGEEFPCAL